MSHRVCIIASDGVLAYELVATYEVFHQAGIATGAYDVRVCSDGQQVSAGPFAIQTLWDMAELQLAGTVVVPGVAKWGERPSSVVVEGLAKVADAGARILAISSGTSVLAAAGLLDRDLIICRQEDSSLADQLPGVRCDTQRQIVQSGRIMTATNALAGLQACLSLIEQDHGKAVSSPLSSRFGFAIVNHERRSPSFLPEPVSLGPTMKWAVDNLHARIGVPDLAKRSKMSERTLARRFRQELGTSPGQWLVLQQLKQGRALLETSSDTIEEVALKVGFETGRAFVARFKDEFGVSPAAFRRKIPR